MSEEPGHYSLDKSWVRRSFDKASSTYDAAAVLQAEVRSVLLTRLELTKLDPRRVLDLGAGTGLGGRALKRRYPGAQVVALDSSLGMLRAAGRQSSWLRPLARLCADAERLPLPDNSIDLMVSNLMLQWSDPVAVFAECRRVLAPRGFLSFSTLGPDTLRELRAAWLKAGGPVDCQAPAAAHTHVNLFPDMHDLGDALVRAGFVSPVLDVDRYTLEYLDVRALMKDLKAIGARNATAGRPKGLTTRSRFAAMESAYEGLRSGGRLPATYEVIFGQAWAPLAASAPTADSTYVPLNELKRQLQGRRGS